MSLSDAKRGIKTSAARHSANSHKHNDIIDVIMAFSLKLEYDETLDILVSKMMGLTNSDAGTLYILEDNELQFRIIKNKSMGINKAMNDDSDWPPILLDVTNIENVSAYSAIKQEVVMIEDVYDDTKFNFQGTKKYDELIGYRTKSMLVLPLIAHNGDESDVLGVIQLINAVDPVTGKYVSHENTSSISLIAALARIAANTLIRKAEDKRAYDVEKIFEAVLAFNNVSDQTMLLSIILTKMMEVTNSDAGTFYTVDDEKLNFRILLNKTLGIFKSSEADEINLPPIALNENSIQNVSAYSAIKNEIVLIDDVYQESERFNFSGPKEYDTMTGYRTRAMLVVPVCMGGHNDNVLGVIQMMNPIDPVTGEFGTYDNIYEPPIVPALAKIAANTLSNLMHVKEVRQLFRSFSAVLTQAIDERSPYNNNHTQNVARYCEQFALYLSRVFPKGHVFHFDVFHIEKLVLAALLHDIGKIVTPLAVMDKTSRLGEKIEAVRYRFELKKYQTENEWLHGRITDEQYASEKDLVNEAQEFVEHINTSGFLHDQQLEKVKELGSITYKNAGNDTVSLLDASDLDALSIRSGTLTSVEREIMQQHVVITGRLLDKIPIWNYYESIPQWASYHHEFLDGSGYPQGLSGEEIPIEACIITIMDIFDALTAKDRPYKKPFEIDKSLEILTQMADEGKLHKELVSLFVKSKSWEEKTHNG